MLAGSRVGANKHPSQGVLADDPPARLPWLHFGAPA
jgi:hypothetical protein